MKVSLNGILFSFCSLFTFEL